MKLAPPKLKRDEGASLSPIARLERRVIWNLIKHLGLQGFYPASVETARSKDQTVSPRDMMESLFAYESARLKFRKGEKLYWVDVVFGNSGWDCISDYAQAAEGWVQAIQGFDGEIFAESP